MSADTVGDVISIASSHVLDRWRVHDACDYSRADDTKASAQRRPFVACCLVLVAGGYAEAIVAARPISNSVMGGALTGTEEDAAYLDAASTFLTPCCVFQLVKAGKMKHHIAQLLLQAYLELV